MECPLLGRELVLPVCLLVNLMSSICIVVLNKWLYTYHHFPNITLTALHFVMTWLGLVGCAAAGLFKPTKLRIMSVVPLAMSFCGFVVFTNLSLESNTVGTYQLMKAMTTPCIVVIHTYFYNKRYSVPVLLTLIPITLGVVCNSYYDVRFNVWGTAYATIGVLVTSVYQVWVGTKQTELEASSMQLLFYQAPISACMLSVVVFLQEPPWSSTGLFSILTLRVSALVLLSGVVAFSVNLSIFWIIGKTSPVTYNMVGHTKFCITVLSGTLIFHDPISLNQAVGMFLTFSGVLTYTHFKIGEQSSKNSGTQHMKTSA
ncbi:solute carrier family 35 member E3-like [Sycon ciliatum]|uniref:solute carrier family 35 member E3-like n=1 Tax=Sycon ciliatum TaxID=27933 RepID=UPI0031F6C65D